MVAATSASANLKRKTYPSCKVEVVSTVYYFTE